MSDHAPSRPRRIVRSLVRILIVVVVTWVIGLGVGASIQERLMFPRWMEPVGDRAVPMGGESWWIEASSGDRVEAWFFRGLGRSADDPGPAAIVFHGNAEIIDHAMPDVQMYRARGISVLVPEYRGYGRSEGLPSRATIGEDMLAFRARLVARSEVDPNRLIYHGRSIGGGVSSDVAAVHPPAAWVLASTFRSMPRMFRKFGVPGFLCRNDFDVETVLAGFDGPSLVMHGRQDPLIPVAHGRHLASVARDGTYLEVDAEHDLPEDWELHEQTIEDFLVRAGLFSPAPD